MMSSGEEMPGGGEQSPRRLSQIFEPLVDFHSKSAQSTTSPILSKLSSGSSGKGVKVNPGSSSRLITGSSSTPNSPRYVLLLN